MNEQEVPIPQHAPRRIMPLVVLLLVIAAAAVAYVLVITLRRPVTDPAALVPKEVAAAVTLDLTKSQDKDAAMKAITRIFEECGVKDPVKKLFEKIDKELGIKVQEDVLPKLSGVGAVAVLPEMTRSVPSVAVIAGARSDGAAADLLEFVAGKLRAKKLNLSPLEYEGFTYYRVTFESAPEAAFYLGAVKNAVVGTLGQSAFKKVADTAKGKPSLLDEPNYVRLRKTSEATFATVYFSGANYYKLVAPKLAMGMGMMAPDAADTIKESLEEMQAAVGTGEASADGIKLAVKGMTKTAMPTAPQVAVDELASVAPKNAAVLYSAEGVDVAISEIKRRLNGSAGLKSQIDQAVAQAKQMLGFDPFKDALDRIKAIGGYYVPAAPLKPRAFPGSLVFVLRVDKPDVIAKSLAKIHAAVASMGAVKFTTVPVGGVRVTVGPPDSDGIRFWDTMSGDKVLVGITGVDVKASAKDAIAAVSGKGPTAASSPAFELVKKQLPAKSTFLLYGDVRPIVNTFKNEIPAEDRKVADAVTKSVGTFGAAGSHKGTEYEAVLVAPFRK